MGKCLFSERWLTLPQYSRWLARGSSGIHKAYCCLCSKSFDISAMGEAALKSHMIGKKHVDLIITLILNICISESFLGTKLSPLKCLKKCLKKFDYVLESA